MQFLPILKRNWVCNRIQIEPQSILMAVFLIQKCQLTFLHFVLTIENNSIYYKNLR